MTLKVLSIEHLRNFITLHTELHPHLNLITGINGSGKTSFLESIYLLSCGKSFRTRETSTLINHEKSNLTIYAETFDNQSLAIQKSLTTSTIMKVNDRSCLSASDLARFLPTQVFYQDVFQIIDAGPAVRRSLLDWGLFHVKHHYFDLWKNYRRALKQRNYLLRQKASRDAIVPWNQILSTLACEIHVLRQEYMEKLNTVFFQVLASLTQTPCSLHYYKGWDKKNEFKSLETILNDSYTVDLQYQYTRYGSHQAELIFTSHEHKSKYYLSRGQQKVVLFALKIAQAKLLNSPCLFLLDDLFAELDSTHTSKVLECILQSSGQFFITSHESTTLQPFVPSVRYSEISL